MLVWGADRLVAGASATARNLGVSPLIIGLTIIGFGTSAPELLVSAVATLKGNSGLAVGNALGSNIANMGLVLGITALMAPVALEGQIVRRGDVLGLCGNSGYSPQPHIHVQVQLGERVGEPTLPFSFLAFRSGEGFVANDVPPVGAAVEALRNLGYQVRFGRPLGGGAFTYPWKVITLQRGYP